MPAILTLHEDLLGLAPKFVVLDVQATATRWATPCIAPAKRVIDDDPLRSRDFDLDCVVR